MGYPGEGTRRAKALWRQGVRLEEGVLERATQVRRYEAGRELLGKFLVSHCPDLSLEFLGEVPIRRTVYVLRVFVEQQYTLNMVHTKCLDAILGLPRELRWLRSR